MAPKGLKRELTAKCQGAAEIAAKRPCTEATVTPEARAVLHAIDGAADSHLPPSCRAMLTAMLPYSLSVPADKRDKHQEMVVAFIGQTMSELKAGLQKAVDTEDEKIAGADGARAEHAAKVVECERELEAAKASVAENKELLAQRAEAVQAARTALAAGQKAKVAGDAPLSKPRTLKEQIESTMANELKALQEGSFANEKEAKKLLSVLMPLVDTLKVEDTFVTAVPACCTRPPSARGAFDQMVFEQLQEHFASKIIELTEELASDAPEASRRAAAVTAAKAELEAAQAALVASAEAQSRAHAVEAAADAALKAVRRAAEEAEPVYARSAQARDAALTVVEAFQQREVASFEMLCAARTTSSSPPEHGASSAGGGAGGASSDDVLPPSQFAQARVSSADAPAALAVEAA